MSIAAIDSHKEAVRADDMTDAPRHCPIEDPAETIRKLREKLEDYHFRRARRAGWVRRFVPTGLTVLDTSLPHGGLSCGAITEILWEEKGVGAMSLALRIAGECIGHGRHGRDDAAAPLLTKEGLGEVAASRSTPLYPPLLRGEEEGFLHLAKNVGRALPTGINKHSNKGGEIRPTEGTPSTDRPQDRRSIIVVDTLGDFYPPPACQYGITVDRIIVVRTKSERDAFWAADQSLRCPGVAAVVASLTRLDERLSRRLQLAAESGGCVGLILRPARRRAKSFSAVQMLVESVSCLPMSPAARDAYLCRITLLTVREGMPTGPLLVDLHHETGALPLHPLPVDRSVAKTG